MTEKLDRYVAYLEALDPKTLADIGDYVTDDVRFADPFNDVRGCEKMVRIFEEMFENVGPVTFVVSRRMIEGDHAFISWQFSGTLLRKPWSFEGMSELTFAADGRVSSHIDRWDSGSSFWERMPVIGWLLRRMKRRLQID